MKESQCHFWGTRGSIGVSPSKYGSQTSCVEIKNEDVSIFFDAGTGIRAATQGRKFKEIILCISHFHWDHIQGLPFVTGWDHPTKVTVVTGYADVKERLNVLFDPRFHPVNLEVMTERWNWKILKTGETFETPLGLLELAPQHHPGDSFAFRLTGAQGQKLVYATDCDYDPVTPESSKLYEDAQWMILDSQYLVGDHLAKANYGHASFKHALDVAAKHRVKKAFLFHYDPAYSDDQLGHLESQAKDYTATYFQSQNLEVEIAKEGQSIRLI